MVFKKENKYKNKKYFCVYRAISIFNSNSSRAFFFLWDYSYIDRPFIFILSKRFLLYGYLLKCWIIPTIAHSIYSYMSYRPSPSKFNQPIYIKIAVQTIKFLFVKFSLIPDSFFLGPNVHVGVFFSNAVTPFLAFRIRD